VIIVSGPASLELGRKIAIILNVNLIEAESKLFPDGESYIRIPGNVRGENVVVVQSTYPPQDKHLIELLLMLDAAKDLGARSVIAVVPYFAYMRQDSRFRPGEALSAKTLVKVIEASGVDEFLTFDVHKEKTLELFKIPAYNLSAMPAIGDYFSKLSLKDPYVIAPDEGAFHLAKAVAKKLNADCTFFEKSRDRLTGAVSTVAKEIDIEGCDAIIVDDIITTGSTVINVANIIRAQGAREIHSACTHPLLLGNAIEKMRGAGVVNIVGTDCVASGVSLVSVAPIVADAVRKWL
jgi:ribose-phosphate pyrophosphokinase